MNFIERIQNRNPFLDVYRRGKLWANELGHVGDRVQIFHKVSFGSEPYLVEIGELTKITYGCKFITHDGGVYVLRNIYKDAEGACSYGKIIIGRNCFIGNNVTILPGVTIGDNVVIGAGAVVTKSIPSNSVAAGIPCKVISSIDEYYSNMKQYFIFTGGMGNSEKKHFLITNSISHPEKFFNK